MGQLESLRKVAVFSYEGVVGSHASVSASKPGGELVEKKQIVNHGHSSVAFPLDYHGACEILVHGSKSGSDSFEIEV